VVDGGDPAPEPVRSPGGGVRGEVEGADGHGYFSPAR
jgi:hypothetical protein